MKSQLLILFALSFVGHSKSASAQEPPPPVAPPPVAPPPAPPPTIQLVQPQEPPAAPPPTINLSTEPVAKAVQRTYHFHEGFYLRASVGFGYYYGSFSDGNQSNFDLNEHGGTMSTDLLIGGSPSPGVALGGGLLVDPLFGSDSDHGNRHGSVGRFSWLVGPFVDAFPDPTTGWHLGGLIGFAGQSFDSITSGDTRRGAGFGGAAWFGYDFWVANEWAVGPQFRVMGARTSNSKSGEDLSAFASSFDLGISVVFN